MPETNFLDLPAELRNKIYNLIIKKSTYAVAVFNFHRPFEPRFPREPTIAAVSRRVRIESLSIYYGCNTFRSANIEHGIDFLAGLGPERVAMLRDWQAFHIPSTIGGPKSAMRGQLEYVKREMRTLYRSGFAIVGLLRADAVSVLLWQDTRGEWKKLADIEDFVVVDNGHGWSLEWREENAKS